MAVPILARAMTERLASQARAVQRLRRTAPTAGQLASAAATHRKIMELEPLFGRPSAISYDRGANWHPITYVEHHPDMAEPHPAFATILNSGDRK